MANDNLEPEEDEKTFTLELTASTMYSLNSILQYNTINMEDPVYRRTSEYLGRRTQSVISSDEFEDAMEEEVQEYKDNNEFDHQMEGGDTPRTSGKVGVQ